MGDRFRKNHYGYIVPVRAESVLRDVWNSGMGQNTTGCNCRMLVTQSNQAMSLCRKRREIAMRALTALTVAFALSTLSTNICHGQKALVGGSIEAMDYLNGLSNRVGESMEGGARDARLKGHALFGIDSLDIETTKWVEDHRDAIGGGYSGQIFTVLSVVSPTEVLVLSTQRDAEPRLIRGLSTEKVTDGVEFMLLHPFVIDGTYKYQAVSGASKSVSVMDTSKFADHLKAAQAAAEEALYKPWIVDEEEFEAKYGGYAKGLVTLVRKVDGLSVETPISGLGKNDQVCVRGEIKRAAAEKAAKAKAAKSKTAVAQTVSVNGMSNYKRSLAPKQSGTTTEQKVDATAKNKVGITEVDAGRTRWLNETYDNTIRMVKSKVWEEVDNKTGKPGFTYQEVARNKDYIEIFCSKRDFHIRLQTKTMELKTGADGKWGWLAHGKWDVTPAKP